MKKFLLFVILVLTLSNLVGAVNSTTDNLVENSFLYTGSIKLVNVDLPDDPNALLPKIYFFSMREGFIFIAGAALLVSLTGVVVVFILILLISDVLRGTTSRR